VEEIMVILASRPAKVKEIMVKASSRPAKVEEIMLKAFKEFFAVLSTLIAV